MHRVTSVLQDLQVLYLASTAIYLSHSLDRFDLASLLQATAFPLYP
jgi:hypothetical protein